MRHAPGVLNRTLLTLLGLLALAAGGLAVLRGTGVLGDASATLLDRSALDDLLARDWTAYAGAGVAAVVGALALLWLLAQLPRRVGGGTLVLADESGTTRIAQSALDRAVEQEIAAYAGVRSASVTLLGDASRPTLRITVTADRRADLPALRDRIRREAVAQLAVALESDPAIPTQILFVTPRPARSTMARVH